jgi:hypothetical protein
MQHLLAGLRMHQLGSNAASMCSLSAGRAIVATALLVDADANGGDAELLYPCWGNRSM